jgi:ribokinase
VSASTGLRSDDMEVLCVGDLMDDVVVRLAGPIVTGSDTAATITSSGGGSAANVAAWLAANGTRTAYVGRTGADVTGRASLALLAEWGVRTYVTYDPARPTGTCVVLVSPDGERSMLPDPGANLALSADDVPGGLFRAGRHLHLSGYSLLRDGPRAAAEHALSLARAAGMTVSVDPSSTALLHGAAGTTLLEVVRGVDLLLPNEEEARALTGSNDALIAAQALTSVADTVVVTLGRAGALLVDRNGHRVREPAQAVPVLDTTGAGDAFAAGFLAAWRGGSGPEAALAAATALAARAVTTPGARPPRSSKDAGRGPSTG